MGINVEAIRQGKRRAKRLRKMEAFGPDPNAALCLLLDSLSPEAIAAASSVSANTIRSWAREGNIQVVPRVRRIEINEFLEHAGLIPELPDKQKEMVIEVIKTQGFSSLADLEHGTGVHRAAISARLAMARGNLKKLEKGEKISMTVSKPKS